MTNINFQPVFDCIDQNNRILKEEIMSEVRLELSSELSGIKTNLANLAGGCKNNKRWDDN